MQLVMRRDPSCRATMFQLTCTVCNVALSAVYYDASFESSTGLDGLVFGECRCQAGAERDNERLRAEATEAARAAARRSRTREVQALAREAEEIQRRPPRGVDIDAAVADLATAAKAGVEAMKDGSNVLAIPVEPEPPEPPKPDPTIRFSLLELT